MPFQILRGMGWCLLVLALSIAVRVEAQTNVEGTNMAAVESESSVSNDTLRAYLQLQEQMHEARLAIEQTRQQAEEAASRNAAALAEQLRQVEATLANQRMQETRFTIVVLSIFGGVSFLAVVLTAFFQWRTVSRLTDGSAASAAVRSRGPAPAVPALGFSENQLIPAGSVDEPNLRLLGAIERLERRIVELEQAAGVPSAGHPAEAIGDAANGRLPQGALSPGAADAAMQVKLLLEKGQSLLSEDKPEAAVGYFDEVLTLDPKNAEALVKKGAALEKMRKLQEAIECYDRAIAADNSMTIAYLHKGGLYNRMERFGEAVECYEQALRTQERRGTP